MHFIKMHSLHTCSAWAYYCAIIKCLIICNLFTIIKRDTMPKAIGKFI